MRNLTHRWQQSGNFFSKLGYFFPIFEKGRGNEFVLEKTCFYKGCKGFLKNSFIKKNVVYINIKVVYKI